jgi:hypothetical protein
MDKSNNCSSHFISIIGGDPFVMRICRAADDILVFFLTSIKISYNWLSLAKPFVFMIRAPSVKFRGPVI